MTAGMMIEFLRHFDNRRQQYRFTQNEEVLIRCDVDDEREEVKLTFIPKAELERKV
jgi:hypothetical protein